MDISYFVADPGGNITLLALCPPDPAVSAALFAAEKEAEQLGFVSALGDTGLRLDMAGGEFCGNASLSAAALWLRLQGRSRAELSLSVSGATERLKAEICADGPDTACGSLDMPLPLGLTRLRLHHSDASLVRFPGIGHVILPGDFSRREAELCIEPLCRRLKLEALGLMLYDEGKSSVEPLVYVPGAGTKCWESSCASGSAAVAACTALARGENTQLDLIQPGGSLSAAAEFADGRISRLRIGGSVKLSSEKKIKI